MASGMRFIGEFLGWLLLEAKDREKGGKLDRERNTVRRGVGFDAEYAKRASDDLRG